MKTFFAYITFSISIAFISWIVGMLITAILRKTNFYNRQLAQLNFIKSDALNKMIGIDTIKWVVKNTFFRFFNPKLKLNKKTSYAELNDLKGEMTKSEIDHLFAFVFVLIFVTINLIKGNYLFALIILMVNILMNLYPSLLQQQNKRRIEKLMIKLSK